MTQSFLTFLNKSSRSFFWLSSSQGGDPSRRILLAVLLVASLGTYPATAADIVDTIAGGRPVLVNAASSLGLGSPVGVEFYDNGMLYAVALGFANRGFVISLALDRALTVAEVYKLSPANFLLTAYVLLP